MGALVSGRSILYGRFDGLSFEMSLKRGETEGPVSHFVRPRVRGVISPAADNGSAVALTSVGVALAPLVVLAVLVLTGVAAAAIGLDVAISSAIATHRTLGRNPALGAGAFIVLVATIYWIAVLGCSGQRT
jgi:hypothetical protein